MLLFLNVRNSEGELVIDPDGQKLDSIQEAKAEAEASARDLMMDAMRSGESLGVDREIEVTDAQGSVLFTVKFRDAIIW
jgi:hypothetical protein